MCYSATASRPPPLPKALLPKRDKAISFRTYQSFAALLTIIDALAIEPRTTAITVFVERSTFDITQREAELFETFVRFTGRRSKKGRFTTIVVLNDTASINFQGQHGLGIASQLDIHTLSLQTGVRIVVFGSFYRALKLPGAFMVGDKHLMSELRVLCPSYSKSLLIDSLHTSSADLLRQHSVRAPLLCFVR